MYGKNQAHQIWNIPIGIKPLGIVKLVGKIRLGIFLLDLEVGNRQVSWENRLGIFQLGFGSFRKYFSIINFV